jgi:hypothetical protein
MLVGMLTLGSAPRALAETRVALVVGNSAYKSDRVFFRARYRD